MEPAAVGEGSAVESLRLAGFVKEYVGYGHDNKVDEATGSDEIDEPKHRLVCSS